jgi:isoquinoline 1-oxidoreductase alpha subunit
MNSLLILCLRFPTKKVSRLQENSARYRHFELTLPHARCYLPVLRSIIRFLSGVHEMPYQLIVNGKNASVDVSYDMPLLWVLRDVLNLRGTKYGCGMGLCGACTVHLGGRAVRSCVTSITEAAGQPITTVEGLSPDGSHPVQLAWQEIDVPQCGYCQAGQIMSAAALLAKIPKPTDADIDSAMNGNLCRCGTYLRIRQAIHKAAAMPAAPKSAPAATHATAPGKL